MRMVMPAVVVLIACGHGVPSLMAGQATAGLPDGRQAASTDGRSAAAVVDAYCAGCHDGVRRSPSGAPLDVFDTSRISDSRDTWARAYRQLQAGTMPPVGAPRPDRASASAVLTVIEERLGAAGRPAIASGQEVADRLARLLWNSSPDAALLRDAQRGRLTQTADVERHVTRMLDDERARAFVTRFFLPWLGLDRLAEVNPDKAHFPDYDPSLRGAMSEETVLFLLSQLRADRDPVELWTANYTFVNGPLARHYGIAGVQGPQFRRVALPPERSGLLGHGSVLMTTARHQPAPEGAYTSPAARATWIRTRVLGAAAPGPFPGAPPLRPELPITPQTRTLPAEPCVNCHQNFFPLGYALEHLDSIGRRRTHDQAGPVDASGRFVDGTPIDGVAGLRRVFLQHPEALRTAVTEQLVHYASGAPMTASRTTADTLARARQILRGATRVRWSSIIAALVTMRQTGA